MWYNNFEPDPVIGKDDIFKFRRVLASCISCRDESYPKDRTTFFIMNVGGVQYEWFSQWNNSKTQHRPDDYYEFKGKFETVAKQWVFDAFPNAEKYFDVLTSSTPLTFRDYLSHHDGSAYGVSIQIPQTYDWLKAETKIKGLYLAGSELAFGGGVYQTAATGIQVAKSILNDV